MAYNINYKLFIFLSFLNYKVTAVINEEITIKGIALITAVINSKKKESFIKF